MVESYFVWGNLLVEIGIRYLRKQWCWPFKENGNLWENIRHLLGFQVTIPVVTRECRRNSRKTTGPHEKNLANQIVQVINIKRQFKKHLCYFQRITIRECLHVGQGGRVDKFKQIFCLNYLEISSLRKAECLTLSITYPLFEIIAQ